MVIDPTRSLKQRAMQAGAWTLGGHAFGQAIRLASNLIMTRLLVPEMFGVMAIASMVLVGLSFISDIGTRQSVVQSTRGDDPDFLNTVWVVQIVRGAVICLIGLLSSLGLFLAAGAGWFPAHTVYAHPSLPLVLAFISFTELIAGFQSTRMATASRNLLQQRLTYIEIVSQIIGILTMVTWALFDKSIWALVAGGLVSSLVKTVSSFVLIPGQSNQWMIDKSALHEILHFGKWVLLSSTLGFLVINGDRLLLGGLIDTDDLGVYVIAYFIASSMTQVVSKLMGNVAFPVLSATARTNPEKLSETYYKFRFPVDISLLFLSGLFFEAGRYAIYFLYDARYAEAGSMLQILSLTLIAFRYNVVDECFLALGKPKLLSALILVRVAVMFTLVPIAYHEYQISGALWAIVASAFSSIPLTFYFKKKLNLLDVRRELIVLPIFFIGMGAGFILEKLVA